MTVQAGSGTDVMTTTSVSDEASLSAVSRARGKRRKRMVLIGQVIAFILIFGGWQLASYTGAIDSFFFGSPLGVIQRLIEWFRDGTTFGTIWEQIGITMSEALLGFMAGVIGGVIVGVALGEFDFLSDVFTPYIKSVNALPRIVLGSIFTVWLGIGLASKVMLAAVLVFFVVYFNAYQGVRSVDRNLVANIRILGGSRFAVVRHVVFPSAMTWIIASLHVALGFAIIGAIVGEFLGASKGLGPVIAVAQNNFDADGVFAAMLIIGLLALSAEALMSVVEKRLLVWQAPRSSGEGQGM